MARIIGGIGTTHVPSIGNAIAKGLQQDPYWKPFFDGFGAAHTLAGAGQAGRRGGVLQRPRTELLPRQDADLRGRRGERIPHADEGWGMPVSRPFPGDAALSWHLIESLVADEFDVTTCQEMLVDHAFTIPLALLWPGADKRPVRTDSDRDQHRAASAAVAGALLQVRPGGRPRDRELPAGCSRCWWSAPAGFRISSTASAPASSTRSSTCGAWRSWSTIRRR